MDHVTADQGIYKSQLKMLGYVYHHEGISQRELARQLEISPPSIAVTAKKLEKMGYISRRMDENDNRMNILNTHIGGKGFTGAYMEAVYRCGCTDVFRLFAGRIETA